MIKGAIAMKTKVIQNHNFNKSLEVKKVHESKISKPKVQFQGTYFESRS